MDEITDDGEAKLSGEQLATKTVVDAANLRQFAKSVSSLCDEAVIAESTTGLLVRSMDNSQIAMVQAQLLCPAVEGRTYGVNFADFHNIVKDAENAVSISLSGNEVMLEFDGASFALPVLDLGDKTPNTPKTEFKTTAWVDVSSFQNALRQSFKLSMHAVLSVEDGKLVVSAIGDSGEAKVVLQTSKAEPSDAKAKSMYPTEYLLDALKSMPARSLVRIDFDTNTPLKLVMMQEAVTVSYWLAPRVMAEVEVMKEIAKEEARRE